jgi:hypothetical protein
MTRPTLTNYPNIELPTIDGDQNVWGQVLNQSVQDLSAQTKTNENNVATATAAIATLNADVNTVGSVLKSIEDALTTLKGGSTNTLAEIEALITSNGTTDVTSINAAISNLQANLGAPTGATLSTSVKSLADANENKVNTLISTDTNMSVREIVTDVLGSSSTGISGTAAQTMIDNSIAAITGSYTGTLQTLKTLIDGIDTRLQTVEAAVTTLQNNQVSSSDFTALQATVNGSQSITGLVTRMSAAEGALTSVSQTASNAQNTANSFSGQISSLGARTTALEDSDFVTSSTLNSYATKQYVTDQNFLQDADLNGYVTTGILAGYNFLTSSSLNNYVRNDDYSYVRLKGMLGQSGGVVPNQVEVGNDGTNRIRFVNGAIFYLRNNTAVCALGQGEAGRLAYLLFGESATYADGQKVFALYLRQDASNYGRIDLYPSTGLPYFSHLVTNQEYALTSSGGSGLNTLEQSNLNKLDALLKGPTSSYWTSYPIMNLYIRSYSSSHSYIKLLAATNGSTSTTLSFNRYANNTAVTSPGGFTIDINNDVS